MKVVGYCRVDSTHASPSEDLAWQRQTIANEVASREWELLDVFEEARGGDSLLDRAELYQALAAVESRSARGLVVTDLTRLGTTPADIAWLLNSSRHRSWVLVSIADNFSTGDETGEALLSAMGAFVPVICYVTFDCQEPAALADFWAAATGWRKESVRPDAEYAVVGNMAGSGPSLWFNKVPEPKIVKNRLHLCLNARSLAEEVDRLTGLGARIVQEHVSASGKRWIVMQDPEGNEFCLLPVTRL